MGSKPTKKVFVYEQLKNAIVSGAIKPGEILNEAVIAEKYGTGKTPTREALLLLAHENLLDAMPRVGYVVSRLTTKDFIEIFTLRMILETEAIGLAVVHISAEDLAQIEENNNLERKIFLEKPPRANEQAYQLNREFHAIIAHASGNLRLEKIIESLINDLERALSFDPYSADSSQHTEIINSLKARDKSRAQEAMRAHISETRLRILKLF
jgi:GntR family transcriptional regulator, rspAB operon transcriptional repressor